MIQKIFNGSVARAALLAGITKANDVIKVTLGPKGRNVTVKSLMGEAFSTKDGIKALGEITLPDNAENCGLIMSREGSHKTAAKAGDATTTTHIIATELIRLANEMIEAGTNPVVVRRIIEEKAAQAAEWINKNAIKIDGKNYLEKLQHIATISANNNEEIGAMFAEAYKKTGIDGKISLEVGEGEKSEIEVIPGYYYNRGMLSPYFINDHKKQECALINPLILIYDKKISQVTDVLPALTAAKEMGRELLIICSDVEGEALGTVVVNKRDHGLKVCMVQCPEQGIKRLHLLEDIAIYTGAQVVSEDLGKQLTKDYFDQSWFGQCDKSIASRDRTVIIGGWGNEKDIKDRQDLIRGQIKESDSDTNKEDLKDRVANMGKGVSILFIGGRTPMEIKDKLDLAEDAILAVRSGIEEGYLAGGGISYLKCAKYLEEMPSDGHNIFSQALSTPFRQILENAGEEFKGSIGEIVLKKGNYGYNAKTGEYCDLVAAGVIDAAKVIRNAIENAAAVSITFVMTEALLVQYKD